MNTSKMFTIGVIVILLLLVVYYFMNATSNVELSTNPQTTPSEINTDTNTDRVTETTAETVQFQGEVSSVNLDQIAFDGPGLIEFETDGGESYTVALPSMGSLLCAARDSVVAMDAVAVGDRIEVRGDSSDEGYIVPCEDESHYLRVQE